MINGKGLAVSVPARELSRFKVSGSLLAPRDLAAAPISDELRLALWLIEQSCEEAKIPIVLIVRPEIFAEGASLAWLRERLGAIADHLCISDGSTIRVVPGLRNHVFFYAQGRASDRAALERLARRVPELFTTMASQMNTALRVRAGEKRISPPTVVLKGRARQTFEQADFYALYLNRDSTADSTARTLLRGAVASEDLPSYERVVYVALSETAAADVGFCKLIAAAVIAAAFASSTGVVIRLPANGDTQTAIEDRMNVLFDGLRAAGQPIPRVPLANVLIATDDVPFKALQAIGRSCDLVVHDSYDFWRHPPDYFALFDHLQVGVQRGRHNPATLTSLIEELCGRKPDWQRPQRDDTTG